MKLEEKQKRFLKETIEFYNSNNRAVKGADCVYSAINNSPGCAIGRHLPKGLAKKFDELTGCGMSISSMFADEPDLYNKMPRKLKEMDNSFLKSVQRLHDLSGNWDKNGLSKEGESFLIYTFPEFYHDVIS